MFLPGVLTQSIPNGTGMFSLLIFYQMLNKRSKQHSLLHFLIGTDPTGFPHPFMAIWFIGHVMWESARKKTMCLVESLIYL